MLALGPAALVDPERTLQEAAKIARQKAARTSRSPPPITMADLDLKAREADANAAARAEAEERRKAARLREELLKDCGVPERYKGATLAGPFDAVPEEAIFEIDPSQPDAPRGRIRVRDRYTAAARRVAAVLQRPCLIALIGSRGPGKTHLGCAAVLDTCRVGRAGVYIEAMDYFDQIKATYSGRTPAGELTIIQRYSKPYLLVIDEVHERGDTSWEDRQLTRLINKRYAAGRATILIANQTMGEFETRIGLSAADRFMDDGSDIIQCDWGSLRGRITKPVTH